jgi:hypothetical protein
VNIHELANLLEHLRDGLGSAIVKKAGEEIGEAATALRGLPDKSLKEHVKDLTKLGGAGPEKLVERIRVCSAGDAKTVEVLVKDVRKLLKPELVGLLTALGKPFQGRTVSQLKTDVEAIIRSGGAGTVLNDTKTLGTENPTNNDAAAVERGVHLFERLRDTPSLTIDDIRDQFGSLRKEPKHVLQQVAHRVGFNFDGGRDEIAGKLQEVLERLKVSQVKGEIIKQTAGVSSTL